MESQCYPYVNLPLPYGYGALEPYIDEKTMRLHHDKHLQTYIDNLNKALEEHPYLQRRTLEQLVQGSAGLPEAIRSNAGGVYNHRFYFDLLKNPAAAGPDGALREAVRCCFGDEQRFRDLFKKAALSVFGSGYAWLAWDRGRLRIVTTPNQSSPLEQGMCPILNVDVWEHAYYLKHYNLRAAYLDDWFQVLDWAQAERNFLGCRGC